MDQGRSLCFLWIFTSLGMGCLLASCVTNYWWQVEEDGDKHGGLWKVCVKLECFYYETFRGAWWESENCVANSYGTYKYFWFDFENLYFTSCYI